jgi:hypothetical protein
MYVCMYDCNACKYVQVYINVCVCVCVMYVGSVVGGGTMLQVGISRVRVPMRWIFLIDLIIPAAPLFGGRFSL